MMKAPARSPTLIFDADDKHWSFDATDKPYAVVANTVRVSTDDGREADVAVVVGDTEETVWQAADAMLANNKTTRRTT